MIRNINTKCLIVSSKVTLLMQRNDSVISSAIGQMKNSGFVSEGQFKGLVNLRLEKTLFGVKQLVIPRSMRNSIIACAHDTTHAGIYITYSKIERRYYWRRMFSNIKEYCIRCLICLKVKRSSTRIIPLSPFHIGHYYPRSEMATM